MTMNYRSTLGFEAYVSISVRMYTLAYPQIEALIGIDEPWPYRKATDYWG